MNEAETEADDSTRVRRPAPHRQAPERRPPLGLPPSMGAALNGALGAALGSGMGAAVRQSLDTSRAMSGAAEATMQGFVERGVNTAYQVIDEYMRRGQEAAQRFSPPGFGSAGPGYANPGFAADAAGAWAQNLAGPLGQAASSMAVPWVLLLRAWADSLAPMAPMAGQAAGWPSAPGAPAGATEAASAATSAAPSAASPAAPASATGPRAKITVECVARQPAEMAVSLEPGADLAALHAKWSCEGAGAAGPGDVVVYSEPGHVHVRLALCEQSAPGRHVAALVDGQGQEWGSLSVRIAQDCAGDAIGTAAA